MRQNLEILNTEVSRTKLSEESYSESCALPQSSSADAGETDISEKNGDGSFISHLKKASQVRKSF